jgi:hypothetical protein
MLINTFSLILDTIIETLNLHIRFNNIEYRYIKFSINLKYKISFIFKTRGSTSKSLIHAGNSNSTHTIRLRSLGYLFVCQGLLFQMMACTIHKLRTQKKGMGEYSVYNHVIIEMIRSILQLKFETK